MLPPQEREAALEPLAKTALEAGPGCVILQALHVGYGALALETTQDELDRAVRRMREGRSMIRYVVTEDGSKAPTEALTAEELAKIEKIVTTKDRSFRDRAHGSAMIAAVPRLLATVRVQAEELTRVRAERAEAEKVIRRVVEEQQALRDELAQVRASSHELSSASEALVGALRRAAREEGVSWPPDHGMGAIVPAQAEAIECILCGAAILEDGSCRCPAVAEPAPHQLYLDDVRNPPEDGGGLWTVCRTAEEAKSLLLAGPVAEASLDHDLGHCPLCATVEEDAEGNARVVDAVPCPHLHTGYDLVKWMAETGTWPATKPRVHSANPVGRAAMVAAIEKHWGGPKGMAPAAEPTCRGCEEPLLPPFTCCEACGTKAPTRADVEAAYRPFCKVATTIKLELDDPPYALEQLRRRHAHAVGSTSPFRADPMAIQRAIQVCTAWMNNMKAAPKVDHLAKAQQTLDEMVAERRSKALDPESQRDHIRALAGKVGVLDAASGVQMWVERDAPSLPHPSSFTGFGGLLFMPQYAERDGSVEVGWEPVQGMPTRGWFQASALHVRKAGDRCFVSRGIVDADGRPLWHLVTVEEVP